MVEFPSFRYKFPSQIFIFIFLFVFSFFPIPSFTLQILNNNPNFDSGIALVGGAVIVDGDDDSYIKLTRPASSSFGLIVLTKPLTLDGSTSFNTDFTFSVSPDNSDGLVFSLFSGNPFELLREKWIHGVEFVSAVGSHPGDASGRFVKTERGVLVPNSGDKLKSWVDYDSSSKKLEIRVSKFDERRPYKPLIVYSIDLVDKCNGKEVFVGLSSTKSDSSEFINVFSWRFNLRNIPKWMHSLPVDPQRFSENKNESFHHHHQRNRSLTIFAGLIFVTGCGALLAFVVLLVWSIVANKHTVFPVESQAMNFEYEKVNVVVEEEEEEEAKAEAKGIGMRELNEG